MNWVIMPYVDNLELTRNALYDVLDQHVPELRVLAISNGSREDRLPLDPKEMDARVMYWRYQPGLLSLSTVWNTALQMVWECGGEHALVVNNDVRLPKVTYRRLVEVQERTGAWFVSACNVGEAYDHSQAVQLQDLFTYNYEPPVTSAWLTSRGGPDFSCFLITRECHRWFQFDEHFVPAYFEDNDYHRRLELAGFGDKIFSVPVPYKHLGSGTLQHVPHVNQGWNEKFQACRDYYIQKWGGPPHQETYQTPFNATEVPPGWIQALQTGQGRPGTHFNPEDLPWENSPT